MTARAARAALASLVVLLGAACSSSDTNPASSSVSVTGNWAGTLTHTNASGKVLTTPVTASMIQSNSNVSGTITLSSNGVAVPGAMTGIVAGTQMALTATFPTGSFTALGSATCSANVTASVAVTATSMSATLFETFAAPCIGAIADTTTQSEQLTLTRQ